MKHSTHHKHEHSHLPKTLISRNIAIVFGLNAFFAILEFIFGFILNSTAILSDAVHDSGDALAIGLAWFFQRLSKKPRDNRYAFGYKRFSLIGALITSIILISGSAIMIVQSIPRIIHPVPVKASGMLGLAIFAIIANGFGAYILNKGTSRNESILNLHALEDVLGWLGVLIVSITLHFVDWFWLDPLLSLIIALFILTKSVPKFIGTIRILLESVPDDINYQALRSDLQALPEIESITELIIWSVDGEESAAMVHVIPSKTATLLEAKQAIRTILAKANVSKCAIELDSSEIEHNDH